MKRSPRLLVAACMMVPFTAPHAHAQPAPQTRPTNSLFGGGDASANADIKELSIPANQVSAARFLAIIREKVPAFQYVANAGRWQDVMMPQLELRDITVDQAIDLVRQMVPQVEVTFMPGNTSSFYLLRDRPGTSGGAMRTRLTAFGLNEPTDRLALRKSWSSTAYDDIAPTPEEIAKSRQAALREILSLLEAAISQSSANDPSAPSPSLKLHEETGVLLMRGTDAQIGAATQALEALKSVDDPNQLRVKYERLTREYAALRNRNATLEARLQQIQRDYDRVFPGRRPMFPPVPTTAPTTHPGNASGTEKH